MSCPAHALAASRGMLVKEDVDLIRELVEVSRERKDGARLNICDLGAGSGTTALSVFAAAPQGTVRVTTLDKDRDALGWAALVVSNIGRKEDWRGSVGDAAKPPDGTPSVDLLLVDTDHTYEETKAVIDVWLPLVAEGGMVWFHDYDDPTHTLGVKRAIDEAVESGQLVKLATRGLGWAGAKPPYTANEGGDVETDNRFPIEASEDAPAYTEYERNDEPASPDETTTTTGRSAPEPEPDSDCDWPRCGWNVPEGKDPVKSLRTHKRMKHKS